MGKTITASFQAKIGWERPRKRDIKKIVPICSYPTRHRKFKKNRKNIQKIRKHHHSFFSSQNRSGKAEKERKKKKKKSFLCIPTRLVIENSKKIAKKFKKVKKNPVMTSFQTKISLKSLTKGENKNYRFVSFLLDG